MQLVVGRLVEPEDHRPAADEDGTPDQIRLLHHEIDRFLLRARKRTLLEDRTARAHVVEKPCAVDMALEKRAIRGIAIDVVLVDLDVMLLQKPSGVAAGRSGGLPVEERLRHADIVSAVPTGPQRSRYNERSGPMLTINEIFHSIQGESTRAGEPCVFVRLTACDLRCSWCDTPYAFTEGRKMTIDDVVDRVN